MASVNKVILMGRLGADPEIRYTQSRTAVANLNVATNDFRTGADGQRQESTEWHRVVVFGKTAENCHRYLAKGRSLYLEGRLQTRSWDDKNSGQKRYSTEIVAQIVQFIGGRDSNSAPYEQQGGGQQQQYGSYGNNSQQQGGGGGHYQGQAPQGSAPQQQQSAPQYASDFPNADFDSSPQDSGPSLDDVPF